MVAMRSTPVAGRPENAAAGDNRHQGRKPPQEEVVRDECNVARINRLTLDDLPTEEVAEGVNCKLDPMKSFLVCQSDPRAEATGKVWSTRWCCRRRGTQASESTFCGETVCNFSGRKFVQSCSWARGHESFAGNGSVERPYHFVR